jgi:hypothetical protein
VLPPSIEVVKQLGQSIEDELGVEGTHGHVDGYRESTAPVPIVSNPNLATRSHTNNIITVAIQYS